MPYNGINWKEQFPKALELGKEGKSLAEIGQYFGVSRQRMKQVFQKFKVDPKEVGVKLQAQKNRQEKAAAHWKKWGKKEDTDLYYEQRRRYRSKKANAIRHDQVFTIDFSDIVFNTHCPILGIELNYFTEGVQENSVSFDQLIPGKGYIKGNVVIMSWRANRIKSNGTAEEHKKIADYLNKACNLDSDVVE